MKAFPTPMNPNTGRMHEGMDLRDFFAAMAMQAMIVSRATETTFDAVAEHAYQMADIMMMLRSE
jgi:hypothetical protein